MQGGAHPARCVMNANFAVVVAAPASQHAVVEHGTDRGTLSGTDLTAPGFSLSQPTRTAADRIVDVHLAHLVRSTNSALP
jgi:hypothetical protein